MYSYFVCYRFYASMRSKALKVISWFVAFRAADPFPSCFIAPVLYITVHVMSYPAYNKTRKAKANRDKKMR